MGIIHIMKFLESIICLFLLALAVPATAKPINPVFLIVPGQSIGKINIGQSQDEVRKKMGSPKDTFSDKGKAWEANTDTAFRAEYILREKRDVVADVWLRPKNEGNLTAIYNLGTVVQIQVSLTGYSTKEGLDTSWSFNKLSKYYKNPKIVNYVIMPDEQLGFEPFVEQTWDYSSRGLAVLSRGYWGPRKPSDINSIIVHGKDKIMLKVNSRYD